MNTDRTIDSETALDHITIGPARIAIVTIAEAVDFVVERAKAGVGGYVMTHNLDHLWLRKNEPEFERVSANADLTVADGQPLVWISKVQGHPLPERVGGIDLFEAIAGAAADAGLSLFLCGGLDTAAQDAADILVQRHPNLKIAGTLSPDTGLADDPQRLADVFAQVEAADPDIIAIGLPSMLQIVAAEHFAEHAPRAWTLGVGVSFSFITGEVTRAPVFLQKIGLEWAHRMTQQPALAKRYLVHDAPLLARLLASAMRGRLRSL